MIDSPKNGQRELLAIVGIAFLPFLMAIVLFIGFPSDEIPDEPVNEGSLTTPPIQLAALNTAGLEADGKWWLIHAVEDKCNEECRNVLFLTRQSRKALGKNAARVRRIAVSGNELSASFLQLIESEHKSLSLVVNKQVIDAFATSIEPEEIGNYVFLVDPLGNVMMYYTPAKIGKPLLKDLRHLLRISRIG